MLVLLISPALGADGTEDWSWRILERMARAPVPQTATATSSQEGFVLRIHPCPASRSPGTLAPVLERLLPPGATLRTLEDGHRFAVLAPESSQEALRDLLATLSVQPAASTAEVLPTELLQALARLVENEPAQAAALDALRNDLTRQMATIAARPEPERPLLARLGPHLLTGGLLLSAPAFLLFRRKRPPATQLAALQPVASDLAVSLLPETRRQTEDIKLALVELGQNLHTALSLRSSQLAQMEQRMSTLETNGPGALAESREALDTATRTLEGTAERLTRENDRVLALAGELRGTLNELDSARDRLRQTEEALSQRDADLLRKNAALEHERAKLAALSLILEHAGATPTRERPAPVQTPPPPTPVTAPSRPPAFQLLPPSKGT